jgi:AcrR family transcriptional regulator
MQRSAEATKKRIFDAATAEFTTHGIAGARVDRIAEAACANKQLIYAYFGNKRDLFEEVVSEHIGRLIDEVPFDADDLPGWAGRTFDYYVAEPEVPHLVQWHALEPGESRHRIKVIEQAIRDRTLAIRRAQEEGRVTSAVSASEILAIVNAVAGAWLTAPPERSPRAGVGATALARRRAAAVEAVRRIVSPS